MKAVFLAVGLLCGLGHPNGVCIGEMTRSDINFFFTSTTFDGVAWSYRLSPNTVGMLWRIRSGKEDLSGACQSGQLLTVARSASLEIKNRAIDLSIYPEDHFQKAVLVFPPDPAHAVPGEQLSVLFSWASRKEPFLRYPRD